MTYTTYDSTADVLSGASEVLRRAALAAGRALPGTIAAAEPALLRDAPSLVGAPGAQAVAIGVAGAADGNLTLVIAEDVAAALRTGPLGADELVNALVTPLTDAVAELGPAFGGELRAGIADGIVAEALDFSPDALAVALVDGDRAVGVLVIELVPASEPGPAEAAQQVPAFTPLVDESSAVGPRPLDLLHDVEMAVTVELGRTRMAVRDLLSLAPGAVVELDRAAGSPVDVLVNGKLIARGEVVVIDDDFGIRISEILGFQPTRS
ncbi:MAG TPA: flagellar motor switch protein FliN [Acidimicrobiales bacterium]|nr:flagellar motor switch protein FliN [Acidimicrobiales bacterium]